jgi:hypothetical protein
LAFGRSEHFEDFEQRLRAAIKPEFAKPTYVPPTYEEVEYMYKTDIRREASPAYHTGGLFNVQVDWHSLTETTGPSSGGAR